jgi:hypothetical protein
MLKLRDLLAVNNWKEADTETANIILEVANRKKEGWLRNEDMDNVPCEVLTKFHGIPRSS